MTAYVTEYVLSYGILKVQGELHPNNPKLLTWFDRRSGVAVKHTVMGGDWHMTLDEALIQAEKIRVFRIASFEDHIKRLRDRDFSTAKEI